MRTDWHQYFMRIAFDVAERATCDRAHVGAVVVGDNHRLLTTGYNGSPTGLPHCDEVGHLMQDSHCARSIHAEINALLQGALHGVRLSGATLYVTHMPCVHCAKAIIQAGIKDVYFAQPYEEVLGVEAKSFLTQAGVGYHFLPFGSTTVDETDLVS